MYIYKVKYKIDDHGCQVISKVMATSYLYDINGKEYYKEEIINKINQGFKIKTKYFSYGTYVEGDNVIVVNNSYIRTDGNRTLSDNLGNLPSY